MLLITGLYCHVTKFEEITIAVEKILCIFIYFKFYFADIRLGNNQDASTNRKSINSDSVAVNRPDHEVELPSANDFFTNDVNWEMNYHEAAIYLEVTNFVVAI